MARPSFKPTVEQRRQVQAMAQICLPQDQIAEFVGLRTTKSLRKHFGKQLRAGATQSISKVAGVCFEMAKSGKYPQVTEFWIKTVGSATIAKGEIQYLGFKWRVYADEPPAGEEDKYKLTPSGEYMYQYIDGEPPDREPPARKPKAATEPTFEQTGEDDAEPEI